MDIQELKSQLEIIAIAELLGLAVDTKTKRAHCPFHDDKTPSLQFSKEKQIATCFSSNCNAGTMDVVELVKKKQNWELPQTLDWLESQTGSGAVTAIKNEVLTKHDYHLDFEKMQSSFVASSTARKYAEHRNLDWKKLEIGYNAFKSSKFDYLRGCITFGLRDENGKVVSMYGRSVRDNSLSASGVNKAKHYYTANRKGLYPNYPSRKTRRLIITESVIDAATLLSVEEITKNYEIQALYGTNGLTTEHIHAIQQLEELEEIILFFDGDHGGRGANLKQGKYLQDMFPAVKIAIVNTIENEDINSLLVGHGTEILLQLLKDKTLFSSIEKEETKENKMPAEALRLDTQNPNNIRYATETANYQVKGGIRKDLDSLKVTLVIEQPSASAGNYSSKSRNKLDLYEDKQTEKIARESAEKLGLRADLIEQDLNILTDLLDEYRESVAPTSENETKKVILSKEQKEKCFKFLKKPNLLQNINELIGKSGVVGEKGNRVFLFGIASSYKMENTLHALIQGSSGSGKTHLLATIMDFMPPEDTINLTRVTESSFYNYGEYELSNKLIGMEDFDGLEEKAELAFRELMSKGMISSSTSGKNEHTGQIAAYIKTVFGPIASLSATTKGEIYEDNMSRCFLISVDESVGQTAKIIKYQNQRAAGRINKKEEVEIREFLRNCMRLLQPMEVINPFADKIDLPKEAHKIRRLNDLFQSYVKQITLLNQYQRSKASTGELLTEKEDIKTAIEIMFDSIILKVDELDGSLRDFYEKLKNYVLSKSKEYEFTRREIRHETQASNTQLHRYMKQLIDLEYIYQSSGYDNRGHKYKIAYWDNMEALRNRIKQDLNNQLEKL